MTMIDRHDRIRTLLDRDFRGAVIDPGHADYQSARRVWNGMIDKNPSLILRPEDVPSVQAAVRIAGELQLPVAVRGGGHNIAGNGTCDGEIVLDLGLLGGPEIDPRQRTARVPGGMTWGPLDRATQAHGLATVGGMVSTTGVGGLTLGGGVGWLMRSHGLTCDNLISAELVTATGELLTVSDREHSDLMWALRGAGGNFGVVTDFTYRLHPVDTVVGGFAMYPLDRAGEVLRCYSDYCEGCPDTLTTLAVLTTAPGEPFVPESMRAKPALLIAVCAVGGGAADDVAALIAALGEPIVNLIGPMPYSDMQSMQDPTAPHGSRNYWRSGFLPDLSPDTIDRLVEFAASAPSAMTQIHLHQMGGAVARVAGDATAVPFRDAPFMLNIVTMWADPDDDAINLEWLADCWRKIESATRSSYSNFLSDDEADRFRTAHSAPTWNRLRDIKTEWDPDNMFRFNQNIPPR
ncbi:FAD-binding oxidoreductase [Nocardia sp. NPDC019395]|uniref:FAD-binding oxidoreductase n=1 Tax=Nocardia sp. NPDC019395 TaxID=3154686 RepID=UPI0033F742AF